MDFKDLYQTVKSHTLLDADRLFSLWNIMQEINHRKIIGDVVECGSFKGGASAVLRAGMGSCRKIWIYDSFQGLPETSDQDGDEAKNCVGECAASLSDVYEIMTITGADKEEFIIKEGWFQDTFKHKLPEQVALLHCDADWYNSVMLTLETFYPLMPTGACIVLDDFGHWEGCRIAFYDFCEKFRERPLLERVGYTQAFWIKGKEHNRNG